MLQRKTTTIQISLKTKEYLDEIKEREQLSTYDAAIRIILLNYELFKEFRAKEREIPKNKDTNK